MSRLRAATARAVAENQDLARRTAAELRALADRLHTGVFSDDPDEFASAVHRDERRVLDDIAAELTELGHRRTTEFDRFSIVLFGRTGTGKSSLLEALRGGHRPPPGRVAGSRRRGPHPAPRDASHELAVPRSGLTTSSGYSVLTTLSSDY
jgi:tRNA U34 5-carboxymethylaminomethyl modifying GTPase MnmE/TrmE